MDKMAPMPIGIEFYKEMIAKKYYYIDKTLLIRDLLENKNKVTLFTRPRRFGKTLAQSMVKVFLKKKSWQMVRQQTILCISKGKRLWVRGKYTLSIWGSTQSYFCH